MLIGMNKLFQRLNYLRVAPNIGEMAVMIKYVHKDEKKKYLP